MDGSNTVDIVIPSFRLNEAYILPLIHLLKPRGWQFTYYIVVDNPNVSIGSQIADEVKSGSVHVLVNTTNQGASMSRNRGFEAGNSEWVLFLDDDIRADSDILFKYVAAINEYPREIGFIGLVEMPSPPTAFAEALHISGSTMIFGIAEREPYYSWGATANMMINRKAVNGVRFSTLYPKSGGGEDVDFFLNVRDHNQSRNYKTFKAAKVCHPWWGEGRPDFKRPFRYGVGNSYLAELKPGYRYYDFPNTVETSLLLMLLLPFLPVILPINLFQFIGIIACLLFTEIVATWIQLYKRKHALSGLVVIYVVALRLVYQSGLLIGNLSRGRVWALGERFDDKGRPPRNGFIRFNTYKIIKCIMYLAVLCWIFLF